MRLFQKEHTYKHPWGYVSLAFWRKYPNKSASHVKEADTYVRTMDAKTGDLVTHRIMSCHTTIPGWMRAVGISPWAYVAEQSVCNAKQKKLVVRSQNITMSSIMVVEEKCTYEVSPDNPNHTKYTQEATINAFLPLLSGKLENYSLNSISSKSETGLQIIEELCQTIQKAMKQGLDKSVEALGLQQLPS